MEYKTEQAIPILKNTPFVIAAMIKEVPDDWLHVNEGGDSWSVFDIIGHLIQGDKTDWIQRLEKILSGVDIKFTPFDRFAQFTNNKGKSITALLEEFTELRSNNINILLSKNITREKYRLEGIHPAFGKVTLAQLLSTWMVHDLDHISQIARVMAKQYKDAVGPWKEYLRIVNT